MPEPLGALPDQLTGIRSKKNIPNTTSVGMGLKFTEISDKDQRRIDAFARQIAEEIDVEI